MSGTDDFSGAKLAILVGNQVVTILRDDRPDLPWPGHWDLPGGGREGDETPAACALRELGEELGLTLAPTDLCWSHVAVRNGATIWFFAVEWPDFDPSAVVFGAEGQTWELAPLGWFMSEARVVPYHRERLALYLAER